MIAEFDRMAGELEMQIASEERKAGITTDERMTHDEPDLGHGELHPISAPSAA